ncbi:MAG: META domain-containing protein [Treponema sp.]|nr:META domain-containing protein [Treponema sp.]
MSAKMKKILLASAVVFMVLAVQSCATNQAQGPKDISIIQGKDWYLDEVKSSQTFISIDRTNSSGDVFTLMFDTERISGIAAPNRYFGPYTAGDNQTLTLSRMGSTLMAPLYEFNDLKEQDYFNYLEKVTGWDLINGKLELYTLDGSGNDTTLVYIAK